MSATPLDLLKNSLAGTRYSLDHYIHQAKVNFTTEGKYITGHLHYIPFDDNTGLPDTVRFSHYIMDKLIAFCIPPSEQKIIREEAESDNDASMQLIKAATETLKAIKARKDGKRSSSGEIGELILFVLLEGILGAPAVASKPYLKMNGQDQVKGCDGVHVLHDGENMVVFLGESKLSPDFDYCVKEYAKSIKDYHTNGGKKKEKDLSVVAKNIDLNLTSDQKDELEAELLHYLNPIKRRKREKVFKEVNAVFLGFDHELYKTAAEKDKTKRNNALKESIESSFPEVLSKIVAQVKGEISDYNFHYFVMPFSSVEEMQRHCEEYLKPFSFSKKGEAA